MNSTELEVEKLKLQLAEANERLRQANQAISTTVAQNATLEGDMDAKVAEAMLELHAQEEAEKKAKAEDAERQKAMAVVKRPESYGEYSGLTLSQKVAVQRLYADDNVERFVAELIAKDRRAAQAAANGTVMAKIQSTQARFKG